MTLLGEYVGLISLIGFQNLFTQRFPNIECDTKFDWLGMYKKNFFNTTVFPTVLGQQVTYTKFNGTATTIGGVCGYDGYPWDYSFTNNHIISKVTDRSLMILERLFENITKDPFRNRGITPILLVVYFCLEYHESLATILSLKNQDNKFAPVNQDKLLHNLLSKLVYYNREKTYNIHICYIEASIAATYYFGLNHAVVVEYSRCCPGVWAISAVDNRQKLTHMRFLGQVTMDVVSKKTLDIMENHPNKYNHNIILCTDVSPVDVDEDFKQRHEWVWERYKQGVLDQSTPFEELTTFLTHKRSDLNIWVVKSHKELAAGAKLFASSPDMELLPKHKYGWPDSEIY